MMWPPHAFAADAGTWCEHRLQTRLEKLEFQEYFKGLFDLPLEERPAEFDSDATGVAAQKFGVGVTGAGGDAATALTVTVKRSVYRKNSFMVVVKGGENLLWKALFDVPPLYVWEREEQEVAAGFMFPSGSTWSMYGMGVVLDSTIEVRRFLEVQRNRAGRTVLTLGFDVDCERVQAYSRATEFRQILLRPGYAICRVPVIRAVLR